MTDKHKWIKFTGDYEKKFYDIKLTDGTEILHCWPNAGNFHSKCGMHVKGSLVGEIKHSPDPWIDGENS